VFYTVVVRIVVQHREEIHENEREARQGYLQPKSFKSVDLIGPTNAPAKIGRTVLGATDFGHSLTSWFQYGFRTYFESMDLAEGEFFFP
jgi:hypothetical protein